MAKNYEFTIDVNIDYTRAKSETDAFIANQRRALEALSRVSGQSLGRAKVDEEGNQPTLFSKVAPETASNASAAARNKILAADQLYLESTTLLSLTRRQLAAAEQKNLQEELLTGALTKPNDVATQSRVNGKFGPNVVLPGTIDTELGALLKEEALSVIRAERIEAQAHLRRAAALNSLPDENGVSGRANYFAEQARATVAQAEEAAELQRNVAQRRAGNTKLQNAIADTAIAQRQEASFINERKAGAAAGDDDLIRREANTAVLNRVSTEKTRLAVARSILNNENEALSLTVQRTATETLLNNAIKNRAAIAVKAATSQGEIQIAGEAQAANRELAQATKVAAQRMLQGNAEYVRSLAESTLIQRNISARQNAIANAALLGGKVPSAVDSSGASATGELEAYNTVANTLLTNRRKVEQLSQLSNLPGGREAYIAAEAEATTGQKLLSAEIRAEQRQRLAANTAYTDALGAGVVAQREIDSKRAAFVAQATRGTSNDPVANQQGQATAVRDAQTKVVEAYNTAAAKIAEQAAIGGKDSASRAAYIAAQAEATAGEKALAKITEAEVAERLAADPAYLSAQARVTIANKQLASRIEQQVAAQTGGAASGQAGIFQRLQAYIKNLNKAPLDRVEAESQSKLSQFIGQKALTTGGFAVSGVALYGTFNAIKTAVEEANKFQVNMVAIEQQLKSTDEAGKLSQVKASLLEISNQTGIAGSEVAQLALLMKGAFGDTETAIRNTSDALKVSVVSGLNDNEITNLLLGIAKAYQTTIEAIGDVALGIQQRTGVAAKEVIQGIAQLAPVAAEVGLPIEHIGNILAIAEQQSGRSATAIAENFNRILPAIQKNGVAILDLIAAVPGLDKEYQKLGADLNQGKSGAFFEDLIQVFDKLNPAAQNTIIELIGGRREAGALIPVLRNVAQLNELNAKTAENAGLTNEYFAKTMDTLHRQVSVLANEFRNFIGLLFRSGIADVFVVALVAVQGLLGGLQLMAGVLKDVNEFSHGLLGTFAAIVAGLVIINKLRSGGSIPTPGRVLGRVTGASEVTASVTGAAAELKGAATVSAETQKAGAVAAADTFTAGVSGAGSEFVAAVSSELQAAVGSAAEELVAGAGRASVELAAGAARASEILGAVTPVASSEGLVAGAEGASAELLAGGIQAGEEMLAGAIRAGLELSASAGSFAVAIGDAAAAFTAAVSTTDVVAAPETSGLIAAAEQLTAAGIQVAADITDSGALLVTSVSDAAAAFVSTVAESGAVAAAPTEISTAGVDAALVGIIEAADILEAAGAAAAEFVVDAADIFVTEISQAATAFTSAIGEATVIGIDTTALTAGLQAEIAAAAVEFNGAVRAASVGFLDLVLNAASNFEGIVGVGANILEGSATTSGEIFADVVQLAATDVAEKLVAAADAFTAAVSEGGGVGTALAASGEGFSETVLTAGEAFRAAVLDAAVGFAEAEALGIDTTRPAQQEVSTVGVEAALTEAAANFAAEIRATAVVFTTEIEAAGTNVAADLVGAGTQLTASVVDAGTVLVAGVSEAATELVLAVNEILSIGFVDSGVRNIPVIDDAELSAEFQGGVQAAVEALIAGGESVSLELLQGAEAAGQQFVALVESAGQALVTAVESIIVAEPVESGSAGAVITTSAETFAGTVIEAGAEFRVAVAEAIGSIVIPEAAAAAPVEISTEAISTAAAQLAEAGNSVAAELNAAGTDVASALRAASENLVASIGEASTALSRAAETLATTTVPEASSGAAATEIEAGAEAAAARLAEGALTAGRELIAAATTAGEALITGARAASTALTVTSKLPAPPPVIPPVNRLPVAPTVSLPPNLIEQGAAKSASVAEIEAATAHLAAATEAMATVEAERVAAEQALLEAHAVGDEAEIASAEAVFVEMTTATREAGIQVTAALAEARAVFTGISSELAATSPQLAAAAKEMSVQIVGAAVEFNRIVDAAGLTFSGEVTAAGAVNAAGGAAGALRGAAPAAGPIVTDIYGGAATKIPILPGLPLPSAGVAIAALIGFSLYKQQTDHAKENNKNLIEFSKKFTEEYIKKNNEVIDQYKDLLAGQNYKLPTIEPLSLPEIFQLKKAGFSKEDIDRISGEDREIANDIAISIEQNRDDAIKQATEEYDKSHQSVGDHLRNIFGGKGHKDKKKIRKEVGKAYDKATFEQFLKPELDALTDLVGDGGSILAFDPQQTVEDAQKALDKAEDALRDGVKKGLSSETLRPLEKKRAKAQENLNLAKFTAEAGKNGAISGEGASQELRSILKSLGDGTDKAKNEAVEKYIEKLQQSKDPNVRKTGHKAAEIVANYKKQLAASTNSTETLAQLDELKALYDAGADDGSQYFAKLKSSIAELRSLQDNPGGLALPDLRKQLAEFIKAENDFIQKKATEAEDDANYAATLTSKTGVESAADKLKTATAHLNAISKIGGPETKSQAQKVIDAQKAVFVQALRASGVSLEEELRILREGFAIDPELAKQAGLGLGKLIRPSGPKSTPFRDDGRAAVRATFTAGLETEAKATEEFRKQAEQIAAGGSALLGAKADLRAAIAGLANVVPGTQEARDAILAYFRALAALEAQTLADARELADSAAAIQTQRDQGNPAALANDAAADAARHKQEALQEKDPHKRQVLLNNAEKEQIAANQQSAAAQDAINQAQLALLQAQTQDPVRQAQLAIQAADQQAAVAARLGDQAGQLQAAANRISAQRALSDALSQIAAAHNAYLIAVANFYGDTVKAAQLNVQETQRVLNEAIAQGKGQAAIEQAGAAAVNAMAAARDAAFADQAAIIDFNLHLKKISSATAIAELNALLAAEKAAGVGGQQLRDLEAKIYDLKQSLNADLQYNLPSDLKLPTLYEARRLNQSGATSNDSHYQDNRQIVVNVNGAGDAKGVADQVVTALNAPNRYGVRPRTYR